MHRVGLNLRAFGLLGISLFATSVAADQLKPVPDDSPEQHNSQGGSLVLQDTSYISRLQFPALFNPMELCCRDFTGDGTDDDVYGSLVALSASLGDDLGEEITMELETGNLAPLIDWITAPMAGTAGSVTMRVYPSAWLGVSNYIERSAGLGQYSVDADNGFTPNDFTGSITDTGLVTLMGDSIDLPLVLGPQGLATTTLADVELTGQLTFDDNACLGICSEDATGGDPSPQGGLEVSGTLSLDDYFTTLDTAYRQCSCAGIDPGQPVFTFGENVGMGTYEAACTANTGTPGNCTDGCANLSTLCPTINLTPNFADLDLNSNTINDAFSVGMRWSLAGAQADACSGTDCPTGLGTIFEDGFEDGTVGGGNQPPVVNNQLFMLDENSPNGTAVGTVVASDPDSMPPDNTLSWALIGGTGVTAFAIDSTNGNLTVADTSLLDFEAMPSFELTVLVADGGTPRLSDTAVITVELNNLPEGAIANDDEFITDEDTMVVGNVNADNGFGPDEDGLGGQNLTVTLVNGTAMVGVDVTNADGSTINLSANGDLLFTPAASYQSLPLGDVANTDFTYAVEDAFMGQDGATVSVVINGLNDPPEFTAFTTVKVALVDQAFVYDVPAGLIIDPDNDPLTIAADLSDGSPLPGWLSFDDMLLRFTGMPVAADRELTFVRLTATDPHGASASQVFALAIVDEEVLGTPSADDLQLTNNTSQLVRGGTENDNLGMDDQSDIYFYSPGDGFDVIDDNGLFDNDWLLFEGFTMADVTFTRWTNGSDLLIQTSQGDELLVRNALNNDSNDQIERFAFDGGEVLTIDEVRNLILLAKSTVNNDELIGFNQVDVINGGPGLDSLVGNDAADIYLYQPGDGWDWLNDGGVFDTDALEISTYTSGLAQYRRIRNTDTLEIQFSNEDRLWVLASTNSDASALDEIRYVDEPLTQTMADLRALLVTQTQSSGDDHVLGFRRTDSLVGGPGDDYVSGQDAADTYHYGMGDGHDIIQDQGVFDTDELIIDDFAQGSVTFSRPPGTQSFLLEIDASHSILLVENLAGSADAIDNIHFSTGMTDVNIDAMKQIILAGLQTPGDDVVLGFSLADIINAGTGNDLVDGRDGSDQYTYSVGDDEDVLLDSGTFDTDTLTLNGYSSLDVGGSIQLFTNTSSPDDVLMDFGGGDRLELLNALSGPNRLESITFTVDANTLNQTDFGNLVTANATVLPEVLGSGIAETLTSTPLNEVLIGMGGDDVYDFAVGSGQDIFDDNGIGDIDTVRLIGYASTDASFRRRPGREADLQIDLPGSDRIIVRNYLQNADRVESFEFTLDAMTLTLAQVEQMIIDQLQTPGSDWVTGTSSNNVIDAGPGNDRLSGGTGSDTYEYIMGDGHDTVDDNGLASTDVIEITGYASTVASYTLNPLNREDVLITLSASDSINLINSLNGGSADTIEQIVFIDDGVTLTPEDLRTILIMQMSTAGDDFISAFANDDTLPGSPGDDHLFGLAGSDTYQYGMGDGHDRIEDNGLASTDVVEISDYLPADVTLLRHQADASSVRLLFTADDSLTLINTLSEASQDRIEQIAFVDDPGSTVWTMADLRTMLNQQAITASDDLIFGTGTGDTLTSATGFDRTVGLGGSDDHVFTAGQGTLTVRETSTIETNTVQVMGYSSTDAQFRALVPNSDILLIEFAGSNDRILIPTTLFVNEVIDSITFDGDGVTLTIPDIEMLL